MMLLLFLFMFGGDMRAKGFSLIELMIVIGIIALINIVMIISLDSNVPKGTSFVMNYPKTTTVKF